MNDIQKELETLKAKIAELEGKLKPKPTSNGRFKPKAGESFWCLDGLNRACYNPNYLDAATPHYKAGNCYRTKEETQYIADRKQAEVDVTDRLRELEGDWVADWSDGNKQKSYPYYDHRDRQLGIEYSSFIQCTPAEWSSTRSAWEDVIEEMPEKVKLMLGVRA